MMTQKNIDIPAVRDKELRGILADLGILLEFESRRTQCTYCGQTVDWLNLGAIVVVEDHVVLVCDSAECLEDAVVREK